MHAGRSQHSFDLEIFSQLRGTNNETSERCIYSRTDMISSGTNAWVTAPMDFYPLGVILAVCGRVDILLFSSKDRSTNFAGEIHGC